MLCIPRLRIAILNEEIALWEKRLSDKPDDIPYLGYIRTTLRGRIKELEKMDKAIVTYIAVLKAEIEHLKSKLEPHDTGHIHTTISTLQHRVRELESKG